MDKSKLGWANIIINGLYSLLGIVSMILDDIYSGLYHTNRDAAMVIYHMGSAMWPFILLIIPFFFIPTHFVTSIIGIIKSKKALPYLLTPIIPVLVWFFVMVTAAKYV